MSYLLCGELTLTAEYDVSTGRQHCHVNSNGSWTSRRWSHALCSHQLPLSVSSQFTYTAVLNVIILLRNAADYFE